MRIAIVYPKQETAKKWRDAIAAEVRDAQVEIWTASAPTAPADYAVGWGPPAEFFPSQPRLRAFFSTGAGVENIIGNAHLPASLPVIRIEDAGMGQQMIDYCLGEVLQWLQRRDLYATQQAAGLWKQHAADDRSQWPIGLFGYGVLGKQVAAAFTAHGFPVHACTRSAGHDDSRVNFYSAVRAGDFERFMNAARVLIVMAPLTAETRDRFDRDALKLLQRDSFVINVARGALIVDDALLELLDAGHIAGATLDVFRQEPLPADHRFWKHSKVRVTPHVAAVTVIAPSARQIAEKLQQLARGESVSGLVQRERGY